MPAAPRTNVKAMKIAYKILKTPKDKQQYTNQKPDEKRLRAWYVDSLPAR